MHPKKLSCWMVGTLAILLLASCRSAPTAAAGDSSDRIAISRRLPAMNGDSLNVTLVEVSYEPGGSSQPHSHPCPVFGYVIRGALRTQVEGELEVTYRAGDGFYEEANRVHAVSGNASTRDSVTFLAYFVCDRQPSLSVPLTVR